MILEKYFPAVMKIYRNYFLPLLYSQPLSLGYHMSSLSRILTVTNVLWLNGTS